MNKINYKALFYIFSGTAILIWIGLVAYADIKTAVDVMKKVPQACGYSFLLFLVFEKILWKYKPFSFLIPYPSLNGTWSGTLLSNYIFDDGSKCSPVEVTLVIKQSMLSISCEMFTKESSSESYIGSIIKSHEGNIKHLVFSYHNNPRAIVQHRSKNHQGTAKLRIIEKPEKCLKGNYWTERGSVGELDLKFYSKELFDDFVEKSTSDN